MSAVQILQPNRLLPLWQRALRCRLSCDKLLLLAHLPSRHIRLRLEGCKICLTKLTHAFVSCVTRYINNLACPIPDQGGLFALLYREMFYCLNATDGCGCDSAISHGSPEDILPSSCIPLIDNHDGTVSGEIDGRTVGERRFVSFKFFERRCGISLLRVSSCRCRMNKHHYVFCRGVLVIRRPTGELDEIVVTRWSDGSSCDLSNCFFSVEFEADCIAHGPFSISVNTARTSSCACIPGYARVAGHGGWQCELQSASNSPPTAAKHDISKIIGYCVLVRYPHVLLQ